MVSRRITYRPPPWYPAFCCPSPRSRALSRPIAPHVSIRWWRYGMNNTRSEQYLLGTISSFYSSQGGRWMIFIVAFAVFVSSVGSAYTQSGADRVQNWRDD